MKNVSISLTDQHAAEIDALIATGDYASVSEVIRAALRGLLGQPWGPSMEQIERDIVAYEASKAAGEPMYSLDEVRALLRDDARTDRGVDAAE